MSYRAWGWACVLVVLTGCSLSRQPADLVARERVRAEAVVLPAWPVFETSGLREVKLDIPTDGDAPAGESFMLAELLGFPIATPVGNGMVRENLAIRGGPRDAALQTELDYFAWRPGNPPPAILGRSGAIPAVEAPAARRALMTANFRQTFVVLPRDPETEPRGLCVHLASIRCTRQEFVVAGELASRGWTVLLAHGSKSSVAGGVDYEEDVAAKKAEAVSMSPSEAMARICETSDQYQAEYADAAAAAVSYLRQRRAELAGLPVVVTGYSLGAIMTPTAVARIGADVQGVVMFVGGANMPGITVESSVVRDENGPVSIVRRAPPEERERLIEEGLRSVPLDGYHTAPLLASRPVLVIHASEDGMVPSKYGDLLWERAGRPERWARDTGHMMMFLMLADQAREIADWIDREVPGAGVRVGGGGDR
jgi:hypothetical protein